MDIPKLIALQLHVMNCTGVLSLSVNMLTAVSVERWKHLPQDYYV